MMFIQPTVDPTTWRCRYSMLVLHDARSRCLLVDFGIDKEVADRQSVVVNKEAVTDRLKVSFPGGGIPRIGDRRQPRVDSMSGVHAGVNPSVYVDAQLSFSTLIYLTSPSRDNLSHPCSLPYTLLHPTLPRNHLRILNTMAFLHLLTQNTSSQD